MTYSGAEPLETGSGGPGLAAGRIRVGQQLDELDGLAVLGPVAAGGPTEHDARRDTEGVLPGRWGTSVERSPMQPVGREDLGDGVEVELLVR